MLGENYGNLQLLFLYYEQWIGYGTLLYMWIMGVLSPTMSPVSSNSQKLETIVMFLCSSCNEKTLLTSISINQSIAKHHASGSNYVLNCLNAVNLVISRILRQEVRLLLTTFIIHNSLGEKNSTALYSLLQKIHFTSFSANMIYWRKFKHKLDHNANHLYWTNPNPIIAFAVVQLLLVFTITLKQIMYYGSGSYLDIFVTIE